MRQRDKVTGRQTERHGDRESHRETWCQGDTERLGDRASDRETR